MELDARAPGGRVSTDIPVTTAVQSKLKQNKLQGVINGGGPLLKLRTLGGNVNLRKKPIAEPQRESEWTK